MMTGVIGIKKKMIGDAIWNSLIEEVHAVNSNEDMHTFNPLMGVR